MRGRERSVDCENRWSTGAHQHPCHFMVSLFEQLLTKCHVFTTNCHSFSFPPLSVSWLRQVSSYTGVPVLLDAWKSKHDALNRLSHIQSGNWTQSYQLRFVRQTDTTCLCEIHVAGKFPLEISGSSLVIRGLMHGEGEDTMLPTSCQTRMNFDLFKDDLQAWSSESQVGNGGPWLLTLS